MLQVVAIDMSASTAETGRYHKDVALMLDRLTQPFYVITWNERAKLFKFPGWIHFDSEVYPVPQTFMELLTHLRDPIDLHVVTDGQIQDRDVADCRKYRQDTHTLSSGHVTLHFMGSEAKMNLHFVSVFRGLPVHVVINGKSAGTAHPHLDWNGMQVEDVLRDDSLKFTLLARLPETTGGALRQELADQAWKMWTRHVPGSIRRFHEARDVKGCVQYVQKLPRGRVQFHRKIARLLKLVDPTTSPFRLPYGNQDDGGQLFPDNIVLQTVLPMRRRAGVHTSLLDVSSPFALLESEHRMQQIAESVEGTHYTYISNETIQPLKEMYILGHSSFMNLREVIRHNQAVLSSNLFPFEQRGGGVLWQMVFLYILAQTRFHECRDQFYLQIRYLAKHERHVIGLNYYTDLPLFETLDTCFWYVAHVCHRAFSNSRRNVLRAFPFNAQLFLRFYRDVFEPEYREPETLPLWRLWRTLCLDPAALFPILSHYYRHDRFGEEAFHTVLYRDLRTSSPSARFGFLNQLDVTTVWRMLAAQPKGVYKALPELPEPEDEPEEEEKENVYSGNDDKLDHVRIHLSTCHPLVMCPDSKRHWKDCIGAYHPIKESNVQLFRNYCLVHGRYPSGWEELLVFKNKYLYQRQNRKPELFSPSIRYTLEKVLKIFEKVMATYSCKAYLRCAKKYDSEKLREVVERFCHWETQPQTDTIDV